MTFFEGDIRTGAADRRRLSNGLSAYLDFLRVSAAFAVLLMHARSSITPQIPAVLAMHGREAVAIFFVLSGFVIRFAQVERGEREWRTYATARISRIYPVVFVALVVTFAADYVGRQFDPDLYLTKPSINPNTGLVELLRAATFTNETWFSHSIFGSNEPLWSLGFEVPYY